MSRSKRNKHSRAKAVLRLPDLEQSKSAVLNSLTAPSSQESYGHAINEFIGWYCSEPRLSFSRTVVLRYRIHLEQRNLPVNDQRAARCREATCLRSCRHRTPEPRTGGRHPPRERR